MNRVNRSTLVGFFAVASLLFLAGCPSGADLEGDPTRFAIADQPDQCVTCDIDATLKTSCQGAGCHGAVQTVAQLDLESPGRDQRVLDVMASHGDILDGTDGQCVAGELLVNSGNVNESLMLKKINGTQSCGAKMPVARQLSETGKACIDQWVRCLATGDPNGGKNGGAGGTGGGGTGGGAGTAGTGGGAGTAGSGGSGGTGGAAAGTGGGGTGGGGTGGGGTGGGGTGGGGTGGA